MSLTFWNVFQITHWGWQRTDRKLEIIDSVSRIALWFYSRTLFFTERLGKPRAVKNTRITRQSRVVRPHCYFPAILPLRCCFEIKAPGNISASSGAVNTSMPTAVSLHCYTPHDGYDYVRVILLLRRCNVSGLYTMISYHSCIYEYNEFFVWNGRCDARFLLRDTHDDTQHVRSERWQLWVRTLLLSSHTVSESHDSRCWKRDWRKIISQELHTIAAAQ
jgi:hypothetical protein